MSAEFRHSCPDCSGHLVYPVEAHGQTVPCPHCGQPVCLEGDGAPVDDGRAPLRRSSRPRLWATVVGLLLVVVGGLGWWLGQRSHARPVAGAPAALVEAPKDAVQSNPATNSSPVVNANDPVPSPASPATNEVAKPMESVSTPVPMPPTNAAPEASPTNIARAPTSMPSNANSSLRALWEEADHAEIKITQVSVSGAYLKHRDRSLFVKVGELPDWLRAEFDRRFREDGERLGLIREVNGQTYDLRGTNPSWVNLSGRIIQIQRDGYLVVDPRAVANGTAAFGAGVFHLFHNGFLRVLAVGEVIQIKAMSVGTVVYRNDSGASRNIPVYDPGLPVGALREKVITMNGLPSAPTARKPGEPIGSGSGFFISEDGHFVTNAHVVEQASRLEVQHGTNTRPAIVVAVDKERDLALLQVQAGTNRMPFLAVSERMPTLGEAVFTIGYPLLEIQGAKPKYTDGKISSLSGIRDDPQRMQISVPVQPGNSGGPLADSNGDVVGVVSARLNDLRVLEAAGSVPQNVNYAIKGSALREFLSSQKLPAPQRNPGPSVSRRSPEEAIKLVEKASGIVLIHAPATPNSEPIKIVSPAVAAKPPPATKRPPEPAAQVTINLGNGLGMEFVLIPAGSFTMGSARPRTAGVPPQASEMPVHKVTLSKPFYLGKYEVTQRQWQAVMGNKSGRAPASSRPVTNVSWNDCQQFISRLQTLLPGRRLALPTEAQWEYACRAGTTGDFACGEDAAQLADYAWFEANSGKATQEVGRKLPNAWGLHDMHGNVWEWCADWWGETYLKGDAIDPRGPATGLNRVMRGGAMIHPPRYLRSAQRAYAPPANVFPDTGLRVLMEVDNPVTAKAAK